MRWQKCPGVRDLLPEEMERFRRFEAEFRRSCALWGYQEVRTPVLEYLHLFTAAGTLSPEMLQDIYSFLDWDGWSGERVVLRPDGTIPVARLFIESSLSPPARLFYVENVFSFSLERLRERWQCGMEIFGEPEPWGEAELLLLASEILKNAGLLEEIEVSLSHMGLVREILEEAGVEKPEEALKEMIAGGGSPEVVRRLLPEPFGNFFLIRGDSPAFLDNLGAFLRKKEALRSFGELLRVLKERGVRFSVDLTMGRGFEYYTGLVFEINAKGKKIGGGGRYDNLLRLLGGEFVPACGFAFYLSELLDLLSAPHPPSLALISAAKDPRGALRLALKLYRKNIPFFLSFGEEPKKKGFRWKIVPSAEREGAFDVRDLERGEERRASSPEEVVEILGR